MARAKSSKGTRTPRRKKDSRQIVVTLNASSGEVEKIEELGSTGKRRAFSEAEFATLAGDNGLEDVCEALEAAYVAGIEDGFGDAGGDDAFAAASHEQEDAQDSFGEDALRSGIRRIILRRALRRRIERVNTPHNGAHDAR